MLGGKFGTPFSFQFIADLLQQNRGQGIRSGGHGNVGQLQPPQQRIHLGTQRGSHQQYGITALQVAR